MRTGQSLWVRAIAAIALMLVFIAVAAAMIGALIWAGVALLSVIEHVRGRLMLIMLLLALACFIAAATIAWSMLPRIDRFEPPGPALSEADAPGLFAEIRDVARATGQAPPAHVYLLDDVNAFVTERGGAMGIGSRRVMGIGLPLLQMLDVAEIRAVIAHEFGHFHGGDTKLGPWIYKTRGAIIRIIANLERVEAGTNESGTITLVMMVAGLPFRWFANAYLRVTQAISRAQEYGADALAARVVGGEALIGGLEKSHAGATAFASYFRDEVVPVLRAGYRPPVAEGYRRFLAIEEVAHALREQLVAELRDGEQDPLDSHPPLRERVAAVRALGLPPGAADVRSGLALLADVDDAERRLIEHLAGPSTPLQELPWERTGPEVIAKAWQARWEAQAFALEAYTPATLPRARDALLRIAGRVGAGALADEAPDELLRWAMGLYSVAVGLLLVERGWVIVNEPGAAIVLRQGERTVVLYDEVAPYLRRERTAEAWASRLAELEIADVPLSPRA